MTGEATQILIVDDEDVTRMMLRRVLSDSGYEVKEAQNGEQAVQACSTAAPDLILMDVRMPVMNGFDACRTIRHLPRCSRVPILMLTGLDDVMAVTLAFEAGANDFVTKPINWVLLSQRVRYALRTNRTERQLLASQSALARAQKIARLGQWSMDLRTATCHCSPEMRDMLGLTVSGDIGIANVEQVLVEEDRKALRAFIAGIGSEQQEPEIEVRVMLPGAGMRHLMLSGDVVLDESGAPQAIFGIVQDVTERRDAAARLHFHQYFDTLTGLPNRSLFRQRIDAALVARAHAGPGFAVLHLETDALHVAHAGGNPAISDRLLQALVDRIKTILGERDTLCRFDGEQFGLLLPGRDKDMEAAGVAARLIDAFSGPLAVDDLEVMSTVHIGIATCPGDGVDVDALLGQAGAALARARGQGPSAYHFFTEGIQERVFNVMSTHVALYRGLERGEFELHYQPLVELRSNRVVGIEALLRWHRPDAGVQMPDFFIPILEETGLIMDAGDWVLRSASAAVQHLPVTLSVNVSPRQFQNPNLTNRLTHILEEIGFEPDRLEVEITEQAVMADEDRSITVLHDMASRGIRIALDDYGIGFSSLQRLKTLPLHTLKIDRFFVTRLMTDAADAAIVRSTIDLCHELGIVVVAEGVEDDLTMDRLREYGCDVVQGYGIGRPMPIAEMAEWISSSRFSALGPG